MTQPERRAYGHLVRFEDEDGLGLFISKTRVSTPGQVISRASSADLLHARHSVAGSWRTVHALDLDFEHEMDVKSDNGGEGTVMNDRRNSGGWTDRYYDGYSTRYDSAEPPSPVRAARRNAAAAGHPQHPQAAAGKKRKNR